MTTLLRKKFRYDLFRVLCIWGMVLFGIYQVCHGLTYGSILNWVLFPYLFGQPEYVNYIDQPYSFWTAIGVFQYGLANTGSCRRVSDAGADKRKALIPKMVFTPPAG
jgi:hypothetical protein